MDTVPCLLPQHAHDCRRKCLSCRLSVTHAHSAAHTLSDLNKTGTWSQSKSDGPRQQPRRTQA
jgi:hypothetical protein